jgi:hypothetical protein
MRVIVCGGGGGLMRSIVMVRCCCGDGLSRCHWCVVVPCMFGSALILDSLTASKSVEICKIIFESLKISKSVEICRFFVSSCTQLHQC